MPKAKVKAWDEQTACFRPADQGLKMIRRALMVETGCLPRYSCRVDMARGAVGEATLTIRRIENRRRAVRPVTNIRQYAVEVRTNGGLSRAQRFGLQFGVIGLGRMGASLVRRLTSDAQVIWRT